MSDGPVLCPLGALDLDRAASLHSEAFVPMGERGWTRQDIAELLASPGVAGFLLEENGVEIGMAMCRLICDEAELISIAVRRDRRRAGAGRRLVGAAIEWARRGGARQLFLEVGADNPAARALYDAAGFEAVGRRLAYYARGDRPAADAVVMRLNLN